MPGSIAPTTELYKVGAELHGVNELFLAPAFTAINNIPSPLAVTRLEYLVEHMILSDDIRLPAMYFARGHMKGADSGDGTIFSELQALLCIAMNALATKNHTCATATATSMT